MPTESWSGPPHAPTVLTVDLDAVAANWRLLAARAAPAATAAVVKADAYGLGIAPVARALATAGTRSFFVALLDEALALRSVLPEAEIFVLNGPAPGEAEVYREARLIPVLNDPGQLSLWAQTCRAARPLPAAIQIDTGMSRLGLSPAETEALAADPARLAGIPVRCWMSHLACAETPDHPLNARQRYSFAASLARLPAAPACLANSSGVFLGAGWHFDMVRPGAALFGVAPVENAPNPMRQVVRLQARILQVRDVDTPQTVGYGATHSVAGATRIATIAVGYADGYLRSLSGRGTAYAGEVALPVIGRVSMDLVTLDVTKVPTLQPGDTVDVIGPRNPVDAVAATAGTIGYEILTGLGRRYRRHYVGAGAA
ncbi:MAG: alanine racemase [Alphaproteobacteria bacterium]